METKLITLVHITTVPQSLAFVTGQVGYMKARGFEIVGLSSPGELLEDEPLPASLRCCVPDSQQPDGAVGHAEVNACGVEA